MSKPKVTVSNRDKGLLLILSFILIAFLMYYFVISPALARGSVLAEEVNTVKAEYERAADIVNKLPELKAEELDQKKGISEKYQQFFYEVNEERILYKLDTLLSQAGLPMSTMTISKLAAGAIEVEKADFTPVTYPLLGLAAISNDTLIGIADTGVNTTQTSQQNSKEIPKDAAAFSDFVITFNAASYESAYNFIKAVETMDRTVILRDIDFRESKDGAGIDGTLRMSVYSIAKPDQSDSNDLEFTPVLPKGKVNPFS